ncbi:hypothetical protein JW868_02835 [Candidatus Woesearchaeota archaeon]|nr:hypothetical protein [Candidatus Woesearchaeota archaeon]
MTKYLHLPAKAQLQMGETIAIVLIVVVLVVISLVFFVNQQSTNIPQEVQKTQTKSLEATVVTLSSMAEFLCSQNGSLDASCYDYQKVLSFTEIIGDDTELYLLYSELFGPVLINLTLVYPDEVFDLTEKNWMIVFDSTPSGYSQIVRANVPIAIYFPTRDEMGFAVVTIDVFT